MNAREMYKEYHGFLRRSLNAGARGYLTSEIVGTDRQRAARRASALAEAVSNLETAKEQFEEAIQ